MRIFVTGATGYVGRAVAEALRRRGHKVAGLARSDAKARLLKAREIKPVPGSMGDPASYAKEANVADVLVHCAAEYSADYQALDRTTVENFLALAAKGPVKKRVIYTSGVWLYGNTSGRDVDESEAGKTAHLIPWRGEHEKKVLAAGGVVLRPGCVYGGSGGLTGLWFAGAEEKGAAPMAGEGKNHWATIHVDDCAAAYAAVVDSGTRGELFNVTDRSRFTVREMAEMASLAAGRNGKVAALGPAEAEKAFGGMVHGLSLDQRVSSAKAEKQLGWTPRFAGFCDDAPRYHDAWLAARGS